LAHVEVALGHCRTKILYFNTDILVVVVLLITFQIFSSHCNCLHGVSAVSVGIGGYVGSLELDLVFLGVVGIS
jgi:hypothetical protein